MNATLEGITTAVNPLQPENAEDQMNVTLEGITTDVNPLQPENALSSTLVTPAGIVTSPFTPKITSLPFFEHSNPFNEQ